MSGLSLKDAFYCAIVFRSRIPTCDDCVVDEHLIIPVSQQRTLLQGPLGAILLLDAAATNGSLSIVEHPLAPRALGSPVHTHRNEDEYSLVLEGTVGLQIADQIAQADAGTVIVKPRGIPHAFWNPTDAPARLLEIISPGGLESYFQQLGELLSSGAPPEPAALGAIAEGFGLELDPASIPRLVREYGLRL